jgi:hypothetical protein
MMGFWEIFGWVMAVAMILAFWAFVIYMCAWGIMYVFPTVTSRINGTVKRKCHNCGMARELGHWPGCDYWKGENLDLLIFKEYENGEPGEKG